MEKKKSRIVAAILALILGGFGIHRFYLGKKDGILFILATFLTFSLSGIFAFIEALIYICVSDEVFEEGIKGTNCFTELSKINKISMYKYGTFNGANNKDGSDKSGSIDPSKTYNDTVNVHGQDVHNHEHIKPNKELTKDIKAAQDRLERYKNNNYYPTAPVVNKHEKEKELKELLKQGLISKEEYNEEINNLIDKF